MKNKQTQKTGFAGRIALAFVHSKLTPILIFSSLFLGIIAVFLTPKEEEPQISVPMIDIQLSAPGFSRYEVERKVTEPVERAVWGLEGVEYVYSASSDHGAIVTVRFEVGQPLEPSLVKIHHKLMEVQRELPPNVAPATVRSLTIDDVPFLALSFSSDQRDDYSLRTLVAPLARDLSGTPDLSKVELLGGRKRSVRVIADPYRMNRSGISISDIANALKLNDTFLPVGQNWGKEKKYDVEVGTTISKLQDVSSLPVAQRGGRVLRVSDVAEIAEGAQERNKQSILYDKNIDGKEKNSVTISFSKRKGTNVVPLSQELLERAESFGKRLPQDVKVSVIRDYGSTADAKSKELIEHLLIATISVSILIALWMGFRASIVVSVAIPVTLALTLALYYFLGYTLNRVTLFALIFSIGILVDDAIVVVENIERHLKENPKRGILESTIEAVSEVGNPTILATFTVIAAILPMAFVRGLMGPYMKPIPVGASLAMILSLLVAFIVTPWISVRLLKTNHSHFEKEKISKLDRIYIRVVDWLLASKVNSLKFGVGIVGLLLLASSLVAFKAVKVKMLPFDDKDEFQVLIDFDPKTPLSKSIDRSKILAEGILKNENIEKVQIFGGEAAPFSFSGMVKHSFLRKSDWQIDLHVVLKSKKHRSIKSHEIIESLREEIANFGRMENAITKVLEIPPGPPVLATFVAEVYGPNETERKKTAFEIQKILSEQEGVIDLDSSLRAGRPKIVYPFDSNLGGVLGVRSETIARDGQFLFSETPILSLSEAIHPEEITVDLSVADRIRSSQAPFHPMTVSSMESGSIPSESVLKNSYIRENLTLNRKNLRSVEYVTSEFYGEEEAPVYGILKLAPKINYPTGTAETPRNTDQVFVKWDGEWFITYEVFRDLGGAFALVMILIYVLVLGWFKNYFLPLIIMAPIPISLIGILPGHWFTGAYFTATSMIGFIAGAGIIVRNSIILVDFIESEIRFGKPLKQAVIDAGVVRFRPMLLTASAVVVGSAIMLLDPIFQGLAVSLIFGEIAATILSRFAVPTLYYWFLGKNRMEELRSETESTLRSIQ
ncbi:efflux RND transporter permease subunit [Leptospira stimsonii]|uniref:Efflux RND transporter permease subunit n=1 Tax=Leptospira stimsonii TaxID=2202203 RepID=A0ABY2NEL7_9LEPT|nr:efflux RND transporter permease subunit [Leptospira stimsonii]TGK26051.1 efflux RND transporter permease subunit [Leptospira stimsonii]TGM22484.1 efflux RND transporter permease subunit [Leptospira stimsonii]